METISKGWIELKTYVYIKFSLRAYRVQVQLI